MEKDKENDKEKNRTRDKEKVKRTKMVAAGNDMVFDDVLRTIQERHPQLLIPLINEIFGTHYPANTLVTRLPEGYQKIVSKVVADSCSVIDRHVYHLECQSSKDGTMMLRMVEYDFMLGLSRTVLENEEFIVRFPRSCIIYVRGTADRAAKDGLKIVFSDGQTVNYRVPTVYVREYGLDEIFEKKLLVYLPYYVLRYESSLQQIEGDEERTRALKEEFERIMDRLAEQLFREPALLQDMIRMMRRVWNHMSRKNSELKEEVGKVMGGRVMALPSDKLREEYAKGISQGISQGISKGAAQTLISNVENARRNTGQALCEVCKMLGTTVEKYEEAKKLICEYENDQS